MKTSNLGYPRIGENREWKKALEQYWAGDLEEPALIEKVEAIRLNHLQKQKDSGIDILPVNDFSYYDHVLDTAVMFGIIPERFAVSEKQPSLSTYYAMARGNVNAVAGEMTKWFNTNYHYIIPEFEDQPLVLTENKPLKAYLQAKEKLGIHGKPVILGPYTFIKLSKGYHEKQLPAIILQLVPLYIQMLKELEEAGVEWVQIDEPILVTDLSEDEMETVIYIYGQLQEGLTSLRLMLQTYFDAVEHYEKVIKLPVHGIGLDFVHGRTKNIENIAKFGFPEDKVLAAGIIDGRNIWRSDCFEKKSIVDSLLQKVSTDRLWIQPSCSLLHVPITTKNETKLDDTLKKALAFADEKLYELTSIANSY
ncbi:MAG: 5-methyltetrahydropteroyltriglutamate--homocysteine S-methyltransferase, partial [Bacillus sp. (in: firmicutes)]